MQRSSEFPLFLQTAIAIFGFLFLISVLSSVSAPKTSANYAPDAIVKVAQS
ncbi:MAG: hypothetical protein IGS48_18585 [Oscillatoriales cyanobacterium C42_A2020_001]|nr:hypothetical protein [Leptolyngbyaceae cyanobacterium C42_A2020_001]